MTGFDEGLVEICHMKRIAYSNRKFLTVQGEFGKIIGVIRGKIRFLAV